MTLIIYIIVVALALLLISMLFALVLSGCAISIASAFMKEIDEL